MQDASSQFVLTTGVATRTFDVVASSARPEAKRPPPIPQLAEYADTWLASIKGLVRPRTLEGYTYRLEKHVLPRLGDRQLDRISVDDVLGLIRALREAGYSGWTIRSILCPLSRLFSHAVRRDVIAISPVSKLDR